MNRRATSRSAGFTLLEVLVATMIMGVAVISLLSALSTSMRNAAQLTDHDRMAMLARAKMDELLLNYDLPFEGEFDGRFEPTSAGRENAGFQAVTSVFDAPPQAGPGTPVLQRIALHVWWEEGDRQRSTDLEAFRRNSIPRETAQ